jgi:hypothetical protein
MGYTHYWHRHIADETPEMYGRFAMDAIKIFSKAAELGIELADRRGTIGSQPEVTEGGLWFNGLAPDDYETFSWPAIAAPAPEHMRMSPGVAFDFCKTQYRPYDCVVTACLLAVHLNYEGTVTVESDGAWSDFKPGSDLLQLAIGRTVDDISL